MAGRGGVSKHHHDHHLHWDHVVPPECKPNPSILCLRANLRWEVAHEPLHSDIDSKKVTGVGPGMSFANAVKEHVGLVGLVPCAIGGTAIKEWAPGQHLYENMIKRAKESVKDGDGVIKALLWYQGESDTSTQHVADQYQGNMERLIENVRKDLDFPLLPIIQVSLSLIGYGSKMGKKIIFLIKVLYLCIEIFYYFTGCNYFRLQAVYGKGKGSTIGDEHSKCCVCRRERIGTAR